MRGMALKAEACVECTQNCYKMHQQGKDPSSVMTSFFKVMIGSRYSQVVFLPPRFGHTFPILAGQETQLEDAWGERWTVTLSQVDGSLAFEKGWHEFAVDHEIKVGDMVIFYYIKKSHFVVEIYGPSGCPENDRAFSDDRNRIKKVRTERKFQDNGRLSRQNEKGHCSVSPPAPASDNENCRCQRISTSTTEGFVNESGARIGTKTRCSPEPFCMFDRDSGPRQGEHKSCVFDLSVLEMPKNHLVDACGGNHISVEDERPLRLHNTMMNHHPLKREILIEYPVNTPENHISAGCEQSPHIGGTVLNRPTKTEMFEKNPANIPENALVKYAEKLTAERKSTTIIPKEPICQNSEQKSSIPPGELAKEEWSRGFRWLKEENEAIRRMVKEEPVDIDENDIPEPVLTNISCLVMISTNDYLELPSSFPSLTTHRTDRKQISLRDSYGRLWPVLYIRRCSLKVLASGSWKNFCQVNRLGPGDQCNFQLENRKEAIFSVRINHK